MSLHLHTIKPAKGSTKSSKRLGRGWGSGKGKYSGRGTKGQRARTGGKSGLQLKGIRTVMLATPKRRGFSSLGEKPTVVNLEKIAKVFASGAIVSPATLKKHGLVSNSAKEIKVLGSGSIGIKISLKGCGVSESAKAKIIEAGGTVK
ncbi:MAG: 50S ribosomal protein L15 [uncultured bacterium]|nr:MAG: 50S ribosomal protein L15 [uncultured bacterium]HBD05281.1 50S ribosomal protein L15 [Candidatus Uhrbacteria bacterium]